MATVRVLFAHHHERFTVLVVQIDDGEVTTRDVLKNEEGVAMEVLGFAFDCNPVAWHAGRRSMRVRDVGTRLVAEGDVLRTARASHNVSIR